MSEEALQIAEKRIEAKGKGEKERYIHLNAEFQRISRRDKKAFFSDQCKEIEENNRMRKTRDLFKKIRDTKGRLHENTQSAGTLRSESEVRGTLRFLPQLEMRPSSNAPNPVAKLWFFQ